MELEDDIRKYIEGKRWLRGQTRASGFLQWKLKFSNRVLQPLIKNLRSKPHDDENRIAFYMVRLFNASKFKEIKS